MSSQDVIARARRRNLARAVQVLGGGVGAIVFAVIIQVVSGATTGVSIVSIPLYVGGGIAILVGTYRLAKPSVERLDVAELRQDAAKASRRGNTSKAARLEREADELEAALQTQGGTSAD